MAGNFKPMFWSKYCQTELKKDLVLANWCDYKFDGEIKGGARLKIVGASRPTIQTYVPGSDLTIEKLGDNAQYLDIDQYKAFAFEVDDVDRILPYLAGGGSGLALPIVELELNANIKKWDKEIDGISKISLSKCFYNAGLFQGTTGILAVANLLEQYTKNDSLVSSALFTLNLHLMEVDDCLYVPGDSCFRLSGDLMSGSSGVLLTVNDILENKSHSWMPLLNLEKVFYSSSFKVSSIQEKSEFPSSV